MSAKLNHKTYILSEKWTTVELKFLKFFRSLNIEIWKVKCMVYCTVLAIQQFTVKAHGTLKEKAFPSTFPQGTWYKVNSEDEEHARAGTLARREQQRL